MKAWLVKHVDKIFGVVIMGGILGIVTVLAIHDHKEMCERDAQIVSDYADCTASAPACTMTVEEYQYYKRVVAQLEKCK